MFGAALCGAVVGRGRRMRWQMRRSWLAGVVAACGLLGVSAPAAAEQCVCPDGVLRQGGAAEAAAAVVFWGKLVAFVEVNEGTWRATFEPERGYKGVEVKQGMELDVMVPAPDKPCSAGLKLRRKFMVFATRAGDKLETSLCHGTEAAAAAPIAPGVTSILPTPPGAGPLEQRVARAEDVVVVEAIDVGNPFAGGWHNVAATFKVVKSYKGQLKGKFVARFDERSCGGKKRSLLDQLDREDGEADDAPATKKTKYLAFTYGEEPPYIMLCHDNFVALDESRDIEALDRLCKGGACKKGATGAAQAAQVRRELRKALQGSMNAALATCGKKSPFKVGDGTITDMTIELQVLPEGKPRVTNLQANGTIEGGEAYNAINECMVGQIEAWALPVFPGDAVRAAWSIRSDERTGAPKDVIFELGAMVE
jgi:hypothetical protein